MKQTTLSMMLGALLLTTLAAPPATATASGALVCDLEGTATVCARLAIADVAECATSPTEEWICDYVYHVVVEVPAGRCVTLDIVDQWPDGEFETCQSTTASFRVTTNVWSASSGFGGGTDLAFMELTMEGGDSEVSARWLHAHTPLPGPTQDPAAGVVTAARFYADHLDYLYGDNIFAPNPPLPVGVNAE